VLYKATCHDEGLNCVEPTPSEKVPRIDLAPKVSFYNFF
jgi:hypothetical protein